MKAGDRAVANGRSATVKGLRDGGLVVLEMEDGSIVVADRDEVRAVPSESDLEASGQESLFG